MTEISLSWCGWSSVLMRKTLWKVRPFLRIDNIVYAPPQLRDGCIGRDINQNFRLPGGRKSEFVFPTDEAMDSPVPSDTEFVFGKAILSPLLGGLTEIFG